MKIPEIYEINELSVVEERVLGIKKNQRPQEKFAYSIYSLGTNRETKKLIKLLFIGHQAKKIRNLVKECFSEEGIKKQEKDDQAIILKIEN